MSTSTLLTQWYEEVWNNANEEFIPEMLHKDVIIHGLDPVGTTIGVQNFQTFYKNFRKSFPTVHIEVKPLGHDEEYATVYCLVSAKHAKGNNISFTGLCVGKFKDGKLVEGWNNFDFLKMYQQLGHIVVAEEEEISNA